jgi:hypothetical protein
MIEKAILKINPKCRIFCINADDINQITWLQWNNTYL